MDAKLFGSSSTPGPSRSAAPATGDTHVADVSDSPAPAPRAKAGGGNKLVGTIETGSLTYREGKLYFRAWTNSAANDVAPPVARLVSGKRVLGEVALHRSRTWDEVFVCDGVLIDRGSSDPSYVDDCAFKVELPPGPYTLRLEHDGAVLDTAELAIATTHDIDNQAFSIVKPSSREGHAFLQYGGATYWHRIDARDTTESLQFVWMKGEKLDGRNGEVAKGKRIWYRGTALVDVVGIKSTNPETDWGDSPGDLRLFVFRNGAEVRAVFRIGEVLLAHNGAGKLATLVPAKETSKHQLATAKAEAETLHESTARANPEDFDIEWSEELVCAVAMKDDAKAALKDYVGGRMANRSSSHYAAKDEEASEQIWRTSAERAKLRESAKNKREGAALGVREAAAADKALHRFASQFHHGCLAKLAPI